MYLLDTDTVSNLMRRRSSPTLVARLAMVPPEQQFTSTITVGELVYGAYAERGRTAFFLDQLDKHLPGFTVLPFDLDAAHRYGELRAEMERRGTPLDEPDLRIGAIALARGLTVVTGNVRHFRRIPGLTVENWLER